MLLKIVQKLKRFGFNVDTRFVFPYRATYDFEVFFDKDELPQTQSENTVFIAKHIPMSVAVCSNVPGFTEPQCYVNEGNTQELIDRMVNYLENI